MTEPLQQADIQNPLAGPSLGHAGASLPIDSVPPECDPPEIFLNVAKLLMASGSNTNRIHQIIASLAQTLGYEVHLFVTPSSFTATVRHLESGRSWTRLKKLPHKMINFTIISGLSRLAARKPESLGELQSEVDRISKIPHYPRWIVLTLVSLAGLAFCRLFHGDAINMAVSFVATFCGLFTRQVFAKKHFNLYLTVFVAAFVASMIASLAFHFQWGAKPEAALATSVLFLIPGVPLINSFTDMMDGYVINGVVRFIEGLLITLAIAYAMFFSMSLFGIVKV